MDLYSENQNVVPHVLRTERLVLRPLLAEDAGAIVPLINDYDVSQWLTHVPHPYTPADAEWFIASDGNLPGQNWAITYDDQVIGVIGCTNELGYWLGKRYWLRGFMQEAAEAIVKAVFTHRDDRFIMSGYFQGNAGSRAILTNLGFRSTHVEQVHARAQDKEVPLQKVKLTRSNWDAGLG